MEMDMSDVLPIIENQLEAWRSTGDRESLHQGFVLLTTAMERREVAERRQEESNLRQERIMSEIRDIKVDIKDTQDEIRDIKVDIKDIQDEIRDIKGDIRDLHVESNEIKAQLREHSVRFMEMDKRFSLLTWMIGIGFTITVALVTIYNFI
jgi:chromosome segregation ATPase